jgi:hypothetical protein
MDGFFTRRRLLTLPNRLLVGETVLRQQKIIRRLRAARTDSRRGRIAAK